MNGRACLCGAHAFVGCAHGQEQRPYAHNRVPRTGTLNPHAVETNVTSAVMITAFVKVFSPKLVLFRTYGRHQMGDVQAHS